MASTLKGSSTKLKLRGDLTKTFTVKPDYFNDLEEPESLVKKIPNLYDELELTGFSKVVQSDYDVA